VWRKGKTRGGCPRDRTTSIFKSQVNLSEDRLSRKKECCRPCANGIEVRGVTSYEKLTKEVCVRSQPCETVAAEQPKASSLATGTGGTETRKSTMDCS